MDLSRLQRIRSGLVAVGAAGVVVGLVFSPVVLSIGLIMVCLLLVLGGSGGINPVWRRNAPALLKSSLFWSLAGLYLVMLLSAWQTDDWPYYLERLRVKVPLLLLPFAWAGVDRDWLGPIRRQLIFRWLLVGFTSLVVAGVLVNYALHFREINGLIERGQAVPVPRDNHIRFSLLVALCGTIGLEGWFRFRDRLLLGMALFLLLALHLLAVRSGLVAAYAGCGLVLAWTAFLHKNYRLLAGSAVAILAIPVAAYLTLPSFRTRMDYMRYELWHRDATQDARPYSDAGRMASIRMGVEVWKKHPVWGVGVGNLQHEVDVRYAAQFPGEEPKRPHNQFVTALAGGGVVDLAVTLACFLSLGFGAGRWRDPLFFSGWTIFFLSCLVENTLESSVGVTLFTCFTLLLAYPPWRKPG